MADARPTKRERTRRKLLDAGLEVIADRGAALTASDVVSAADVSNGTFYNHFLDRHDFIQALAQESLRAITDGSANDTEGADPAWRFAVATTRVLDSARQEPLWGRAVLRLADCPTSMHTEMQQHLRADLADGLRLGRFGHGDDPVTVDLVSGTVLAAMRRLVSTDPSEAGGELVGEAAVVEVVERLLVVLGTGEGDARSIATAAIDAERPGG